MKKIAEGMSKECRYLDLDDSKTFALALAGVDPVFLLTGYMVGMLTQGKTLVDAAKKSRRPSYCTCGCIC